MASWQGDPSLTPPLADGTASPPTRETHAHAHSPHDLSQPLPPSQASTARQPFNPTLNATPHSDLPASLTRPSTSPSYHSNTAVPPSTLPPPTADTHAEGEPDGDIPWGPLHPCYPHPNPYVSPTSPLFHTTKIIRIKRDWLISGDLAPSFSNLYPEILEPVLPEEAFRGLIRGVNDGLARAYDPWSWRNIADGVVGALTGWVSEDLGLGGARKRVREVELWIEAWNTTWGEDGKDDGVRVVGLGRGGFMTLDIQIPDPHIGEGGEEDGEAEDEGAAPVLTQQESVGQDGEGRRPLTGTEPRSAGGTRV